MDEVTPLPEDAALFRVVERAAARCKRRRGQYSALGIEFSGNGGGDGPLMRHGGSARFASVSAVVVIVVGVVVVVVYAWAGEGGGRRRQRIIQ
jgi:hypothetical protein